MMRVRPLNAAEKERFRAALAALNAPAKDGDPIDLDALTELRERELRRDYPDVCQLLGVEDLPMPRLALVKRAECQFCGGALVFEAMTDGLIRYHHETPVCSKWVDAIVELCGEVPADETAEVLLVDASQREIRH
jgi:hypothetical protein